MTQSCQVTLLHGLAEADRRDILAELREPTGHDEAMLGELRGHATPAEQVTALLAALTQRIGSIERPAPDRIRELTAGDRERLLLALCARLLGPETDLVATCRACAALAEVTVRFADLADLAAVGNIADPRVALMADGGPWTARLRPPNGFDLERAARGAPDAARELMLSCIEELGDPSGRSVAPGVLPAACEGQLADALLALDPAAESRVGIDCPSCAEPIDALLDGFAILHSGLGGANRVFDEVFRMARSYHWSEAEILALPLHRRRRYIAIAEAAEMRP
jgi:hypothetical protein